MIESNRIVKRKRGSLSTVPIWMTLVLMGASFDSHADLVTFHEGNTLQGQVILEEGQLKIDMASFGLIVLTPGRIRSIDYAFQLQPGDAHSLYLELSRTLAGMPDFEAIAEQIDALLPDCSDPLPLEPDEALQAEIDLFYVEHRNLFETMKQASRMNRCDRKQYLLNQAPAEAILNRSHELFQVLPRLKRLYRIFLLVSNAGTDPVFEEERLTTGLLLANHWRFSVPQEVTLALNCIGGAALEYARRHHDPEAVEPAWNRLQNLLRAGVLRQPPVSANDAVELDFELYLKAFREKGVAALPPVADFRSSEGWISLLAARVQLAHEQNPAGLPPEVVREFSGLLIGMLAPDWSVERHPDYLSTADALERDRLRFETVRELNIETLRQAGYRAGDDAFNPLRQLPE